MLDLQKLILRRLLDHQSSDLFSKTTSRFFTGSNLEIYKKIESFYKNNLILPNVDEFRVLKKETSLQDYFESQILDEYNKNDAIQDEFLIAQLQDYTVRDQTIIFIDQLIDDLNELESSEITDRLQTHLLELNKAVPISDELFDVAEINIEPEDDKFIMYPSGLSVEYDSINGGFALQELVMIGGRRGSGKSILALNAALKRFFRGHTSAFFSIEMRYMEVYYRMLSIISGVPFLKLMRNELSKDEIYRIACEKMRTFYKPNEDVDEWLKQLRNDGDIKAFDTKLKHYKPEKKDNRFFIIDKSDLTLNRIDHHLNVFYNKYPKFTMATVDYINIIKAEESKDWKTQITLAENLKGFSRKYNLTLLSPYQVDQTMEARFAKGILDSADRAFTFMPRDPDQPDESKLTLFTSKIRNGRSMTFDIGMNWECVRVMENMLTPESVKKQKITNKAAIYGGADEQSGKNESGRDI